MPNLFQDWGSGNHWVEQIAIISWYMYICMCMCEYNIYIYMRVCVYMFICMFLLMFRDILYTCLYICLCICLYFLHVEILFVFSCLYTHFINDIHIHMSRTKKHNIYST